MKLLLHISLIIPLFLWGQSDRLDESFNPTTLHDWGESKVLIEEMISLSDRMLHLDKTQDSTATEEYFDFVYRVQLGSTSDYDAAIALEERANASFPQEVMVQFDSPYYKIRVGKMNNREDAQILQQLAIQQGYRRAWVIRTENTPLKEN